ncbi:hypothetical protein [Emticicia sp. BO119]|uniref:hypothetical protein n=1 Tax=Emticicia sp. BO119 TaxID=2757768 RepID=UPI0015F0A2E7|nr:hypothetical protein [Emticicia sp. BO119]MBA4848984.1 hypothetical protein [Emticicia sp. BO119]
MELIINTGESNNVVEEVSIGYNSATMKRLFITLRLPVKQFHSDIEIRNLIFLPIINAALLRHGKGVNSFECKIKSEKENLICEARFYGKVDIARVEEDWNSILGAYGYTQAAKYQDEALSRLFLKREQFFPASTFVAEY